ncbi:MAG: hypothetical protein IKH49_10995 [Bacteroidales bacterium]|nr:hypothetical protein [Bacteroidales bacterium]
MIDFKKIIGLLTLVAALGCTTPYEPDLKAVWSIDMESMDSTRQQIHIDFSKDQGPTRVVRHGKSVDVVYENAGGRKIDLTFTYTPSKDALEITPSLVNREEGFVVLSLTGPMVDSLETDAKTMDLLIPKGQGVRYNLSRPRGGQGWKKDEENHCLITSFNYPSESGTMQWAELTGEGGNLYLASHDPEFRWKEFVFKYFPRINKLTFGLVNHFTCFPGESYVCPTTLIARKEGAWKEGAKTYRDWFRSVRKLPVKPEWISRSSGWLLTILKQQNDQIFWTYPEMGTTLLDLAEERGIDIVAFFGWTVGGHDRFYPEYIPDPLMGGEEGLREAIKRIHQRGKKAVMYFNGQLIDQDGTRFWPDTGRFITAVKPDGSYYFEKWIKYDNIPPRIHGTACLHSEVWRDKLLSLAKMAHGLGADGLLYDQLSNGKSPHLCYSPDHGHPVPAIVREKSAVELLDYLHEQMREIDPDFLIMTEGIVDCHMNSGADIFHGNSSVIRSCGDNPDLIRQAYAEEKRPFYTVFPDLFQYTFPEADGTVRCPTPASTRHSLNFGTVFGFKHEIETRYEPDKRYLIEKRIPPKSEYDIIRGSHPNYSTLADQDPDEVIAYSRAVLDFRKRYAEILYDGNFVSDDGFSLTADVPEVIARAFVNGKKMGVVVWNFSEGDASGFTVVPDNGWTLVETVAPEGTPVDGPLPAQSLRLLVFEQGR